VGINIIRKFLLARVIWSELSVINGMIRRSFYGDFEREATAA
jgi:hypothetical protein